MRRGIWVDIYENDYGQYLQELHDNGSALHSFKPTIVLFALDAHHLGAGLSAGFDRSEGDAAVAAQISHIGECWRLVRSSFQCPIIHQTPLPLHPTIIGSNEHRLPGSAAQAIARINAALRPMADEADIDLLSLDSRSATDGVRTWHDVGLWHRAKQEISPVIAPLYGDLVGRLIAAKQGRSFKCLVLDLDNTLWGGVVGDDGIDGIVLGQGTPLGEAYTAFQSFVRDLSRRGVILAVCSKNDAAIAVEPFEKHPEMVLKRRDIASFVANWNDKATNIRAIANELNIGLDSLVFVDDNPAERALVRKELPMVAVPEIGDDPIDYVHALVDAGYFESTSITDDDKYRTMQYQKNNARNALKSSATDMSSYLRELKMELIWSPFDRLGLDRIVQLINKTNQFNLTTRRHTSEDILAIIQAKSAFGLQLRLVDRFGDNGIIAICIGKSLEAGIVLIDTWLMSCRVLGRQVEQTTLRLIVDNAKCLGATKLLGDYIPTKKNDMVSDLYSRLGFEKDEALFGGGQRFALDLESYVADETFITVKEV
jgi:FkbH-like protein